MHMVAMARLAPSVSSGMESTGVYWKPVYAVLEGHFELIVGNAHHIKNVPGRKIDLKDTEWIAQLVRHGLVAKTFVPPLAMQLRGLEAIEHDIEALDARIESQLEPFRAQHQLLMQIPGVDWVSAATVIAEVDTDMAVFGTAHRLAAWAGVAPGNYESAGKPKGAATRKGNLFLKSALFAAASAAVKAKGSYYRDKYNRLRARRGPVRALMAIAHESVIAAFHMLATGEAFRDLGETYLDQVARKRSTTKLVQRLSNLGYEVTLVPKAT
jgi:transposase